MKETVIASINKTDFINSKQNSFLVLDSLASSYFKFNSDQNVRFADFNRYTRNDLIRDQKFVEEKYIKYIPIMSNYLNVLHTKDFDDSFWKKSFNLSFKRLITLLYDSFMTFENNIQPKQQNINLLSTDSYYIPMDFKDAVMFLKDSPRGHEQIFSIYVNFFYTGSYDTFNIDQDVNVEKKEINRLDNIKSKLKGKNILDIVSIIKNKLHVKKSYDSTPKIGIVGSYFSEKHLSYLIKKSKKNIAPLTYNNFNNSLNYNSGFNFKLKDEDISNFDRFDKFFFHSLEFIMPRLYLDSFEEVYTKLQEKVLAQKNMKYVVSEAWISNDSLSLLLALYSRNGVKHINNEHNFLSHHFLGNNNKLISELSDTFATLGWNSSSYNNLEVGSSLFEFTIKANRKKDDTILYLSGYPFIKREDFSAAYGTSAENTYKFLKFKYSFFNELDDVIEKKLIYRGYPANNKNWFGVDESKWLNDESSKFLKKDDFSLSSKEMMLRSKLIVSDYISTTYIESILMDIPTIVFFDRDLYYLNSEFQGFYDELIEVGIFQTSPKKAADFIKSISIDPYLWWNSEKVRKAKKSFIEKNLKPSDVLIKYLLKLAL